MGLSRAVRAATRATRRGGTNRGTFRPGAIRAGHRLKAREVLAGVVGFEPTIHGTKNRCLTTWLHPNGAALITLSGGAVQDRQCKKFHFGADWRGCGRISPVFRR